MIFFRLQGTCDESETNMNTRKELNYKLYLHNESGFTRTPFQSEFAKYKDIQNGNINQVKDNFVKIRKNFLAGKGTLSDNPVSNIRYHMIISTAITARICVEGGMNHDESYTLSDIYIKRADHMTNFDEILDLFEEMQIDYATRMYERKKETAISIHVRKCIDYIYEHLHEKITVTALAEHVGRHPSYLSKLFVSEIGKPIHEFILDTRITTAQNMLQHSDIPYINIALSLGFSSQSAFINVFRKKTGLTPKQFRDQKYQKGFS